MKRIILPILLLATPAAAQTMTPEQAQDAAKVISNQYFADSYAPHCRTVPKWSLSGPCKVAIGVAAGAVHQDGAGDILIGKGTQLPSPDAVGFVNVGNVFCGRRGDQPGDFTPAPCPEAK